MFRRPFDIPVGVKNSNDVPGMAYEDLMLEKNVGGTQDIVVVVAVFNSHGLIRIKHLVLDVIAALPDILS